MYILNMLLLFFPVNEYGLNMILEIIENKIIRIFFINKVNLKHLIELFIKYWIGLLIFQNFIYVIIIYIKDERKIERLLFTYVY